MFNVGAGDVATLIADLNTANTNGQINTINLTAGTYDLTAIENYWYGPNGLPPIYSDLTIHGNGAVIQRDSSAPDFRLFYVSGGLELSPGILRMDNVTLQGGIAKGGDSAGGGGGLGAGGAIFNQGLLILDSVTLTNNEALGGSGDVSTSAAGFGGGGMGGSSPTGSDFENGGGFGGTLGGTYGGQGGAGGAGGGGGGGGFVTGANGANGPATDTGAGGRGGGLGDFGGGAIGPMGAAGDNGDGGTGGGNLGGGALIGGNGGGFGEGGHGFGGGGGAGGGGGYMGDSSASGDIAQAGWGGFGGGGGYGTQNGGRGGFGGGGGYSGNNNSSAKDGDGYGGFGGAIGGANGSGTGGGGAGMGGAIFNMGADTGDRSGQAILTNCTLTNDTARGGNGGPTIGGAGTAASGLGGAIFDLDAELNLNSVTLAANFAVGGLNAGGFRGASDGGAVYNLAYGNDIRTGNAVTASVSMHNSILATSSTVHDLVSQAVNGSNTNTATVGGSYNLVMSSSGNVGAGVVTLTANPALGPLQNDGGLTPTMLPLFGSPVLGAGDPSLYPPTDQRGQLRPTNGPIDLGAVQVSVASTPSSQPGGGGTTNATPPSLFQALISLYLDGINLQIDLLLHQPTDSVQASIDFYLPYAGPFGSLFELAGRLAVLQAVQH